MKTDPTKLVAGFAFLLAAGILSAHTPSPTPVTHQHLLFKDVAQKTVLLDTDDTAGAWPITVTRQVEKPTALVSPTGQIITSTTYIFTVERGKEFDNVYSLLTLGIQDVDHEVMLESVTPANGATLAGGTTATVGLVKGTSATIDPLGVNQTVPRTDKLWSAKNGRHLPVDSNIWLVKLAGAKSFVFRVTTITRPKVGFTRWDNLTVSDGHDNTPP